MTHPILPTGYNSWQTDGDEIDGAGVNWDVSPIYFISFIALDPFILTAEMLDIFNTGCPDYTPGRDIWEIVLAREFRELTIREVA